MVRTRLGVIVSSKTTNEDGYLMQKFARSVIGTNNVDNCSRYCQSPATMGLFRTVGYGGDSGSIEDIGSPALVLIVGSNTAESHPVLATRVKRAHKLHGQRLIVADPREHEMAERADIHFRPRPGTDLVWISAMSRYMFDNGHAKLDFLKEWVNSVEEFRKSLEPFTMTTPRRPAKFPRDIGARRPGDCGCRHHVRPLGHGYHPAHCRIRWVNSHLKPAAGDRQLYAARLRRLPPAGS